MRRHLAVLAFLALAAAPVRAEPDAPGCKDHPLFPTRMPGYFLTKCQTEEFGSYDFSFNGREKKPVEGKVTQLTFRIESKGEEQSALAVVRNYEAAIQKAGGTVTQSDPKRRVNGVITKDGLEAHVQVEKGNGLIWMRVVEKKAMTQYVVADAAAMTGDLKSSGHVAVYGIFFDSGKSEVKPDSKPALEEIGKLLKAEPTLKLRVVGHTDTDGSLESNLKLSQARAEAVVQALVTQQGVDKARLSAHGVASLAPVATNDTDEGKAKNRRVELVKQ